MAKVVVEDLSGTNTPQTSNPYDGILDACNNDPRLIQERYQLHRKSRNRQQKEKILSDDFTGWILDEHLVQLDGPRRDPSYVDPRNCLVFWARPTSQVKNLIGMVQQKLRAAAPEIWLMPLNNLHMTALEVTHSLTAPEISILVKALLPSAEPIVNYARKSPNHHARLIKPMISYDAAALALSFVPAAGECLHASRSASADKFTYHHFRRDIYTLVSNAGIAVGSRYVVPSAHLTIARFNSPNPFSKAGDNEAALNGAAGMTKDVRQRWISAVEGINEWLEAEFWPRETGTGTGTRGVEIAPGGEWIVGDEKGLDFRRGTLWYGGGECVLLGKGI